LPIDNLLGFSVGSLLDGIFKAGATILIVVSVLGVLGLIAYFVIRPARYNIRVVLWANRAGNIIEDYDRALITTGGLFSKSIVQKLRLLKRKVNLPVPDPGYFIRGVKGDTIYYYKFGNRDYAPILPQFSNPTVKFVPSEADTEMWHIYEQKEMLKRNTVSDFMSKYGPFIAVGIIIIGLIVVSWMINGTLKELIGTAASVGEAMKEAAASLAAAKGG
jgi:hypothetical protein